jgi:hypothetical protein
MPARLTASLSREWDEPNQGVQQASIRVDMDPGVVGQPRHLRKRLEQLLAVARTALADEVDASRGAAVPPETARSHASVKQKRRRTR